MADQFYHDRLRDAPQRRQIRGPLGTAREHPVDEEQRRPNALVHLEV